MQHLPASVLTAAYEKRLRKINNNMYFWMIVFISASHIGE